MADELVTGTLRLGLGTAELGNLGEPTSDATAIATVEAAWECGVRLFDTAPHYGLGLAERRLGMALSGLPRDGYSVSTKVGRSLVDAGVEAPDDAGFAVTSRLRRRFDFRRDAIRAGLEESLERLGLDQVDTVYLHDPDAHWRQASLEGLPALHELRSEGVVGAVGVGVNHVATALRFVRETFIDTVMIAGRMTLLDHSAVDELLPEAQSRGIRVVAAAVFNSGVLAAPDPARSATYDYREPSARIIRRARRIGEICRRHGVPPAAAALHYPLRHPAVAAVVAGTAHPLQARENAAHMASTIPEQLWADLEEDGSLGLGSGVSSG